MPVDAFVPSVLVEGVELDGNFELAAVNYCTVNRCDEADRAFVRVGGAGLYIANVDDDGVGLSGDGRLVEPALFNFVIARGDGLVGGNGEREAQGRQQNQRAEYAHTKRGARHG